MSQERQDVPDHQTFAEGEPEHLVLAKTKPPPDPLDESLMPEKDRVGRLGLFRFFGFLAHAPRMAAILWNAQSARWLGETTKKRAAPQSGKSSLVADPPRPSRLREGVALARFTNQ